MTSRPPNEFTFLHLSDIHFRVPTHQALDLDQDIRNQFRVDSKRIAAELGGIDGILLTGDVAFSGDAAEYELAAQWLDELAPEVGCEAERVWVIPGNHDVTRSAISLFSQMMRRDLRSTDPGGMDRMLAKYLSDAEGGPTLLRAFDNYNAFAARYGGFVDTCYSGCSTSHRQLFWHNEIPLKGGFKICLRGTNSAFISDQTDNSNENRLVVGRHQLTATKNPGAINLLLCHHPPDWLLDQEAAEDLMQSRFHLQLFGHKHTLRTRAGTETVRLYSGALHPDRDPAWRPAYNVIRLRVIPVGLEHRLAIDVWERLWDDQDQGFKPRVAENGALFHSYSVPISSPEGDKVSSSSSEPEAPRQKSSSETPASRETKADERRLVHGFFKLPFNVRLRLGDELALISDTDERLGGLELSKAILSRAKSKGLLIELSQLIESELNGGSDNE